MGQFEIDKLRNLLTAYQPDPVGFVHDILNVEPCPEQIEMLQAYAAHDKPTIRSGRGPGKTAFLVFAALHFHCCFPMSQVIVTANTEQQLKNVFWPQLSKFFSGMNDAVKSITSLQNSRMVSAEYPREWFITYVTGRRENPDAVQGYHAENLLFIVDEAAGVANEIIDAIEGSLTEGNNRMIMAGNATSTSGAFYDSHNKAREFYLPLHFNSEKASRVKEDFVKSMAKKYGKDSPVYMAYVLGEFPDQSEAQLIALSLVEAAMNRDSVPDEGPYVWGLDVARFGDDKTALIIRKGDIVKEVKTKFKRSTTEVVGWVSALWNTIPERQQPEMIYVDTIGVGAGVYDMLRELGLPVYGVNVSESPSNNERFINLRAELWWRMREWFEQRRGKLCENEELVGELTTVRYEFTSNGKIKIESKEDMKRRSVSSPDLADAFMMTFAAPLVSKDKSRLRRNIQRSYRTDWNPFSVGTGVYDEQSYL